MFALWYLTLALEELRKRLGWGSFFSNSNQTSSVNPPNTKLILPKENIVSAPAPPTPQAPTTPPAPPTIVPVKKAGSTIETIPDSDNNFHFNDQDIVPTTPTLDFSDTENELSSLKDEHIAEILDEDISSPSSDNTTESDDFEITANVNDEIYTNDEPDNNKSMKFINEENTNFPKPPLTKPATMGGSVSSFLDAERKKSNTMVDAAVLEKLEAGFAKLAASDSKSLLKKHLTKAIFDNLKNKKTPTFGSTLLDCVQSGFENHDSGFGIYAPDAEAYTVFAEIFDPMIEDYHTGFKKTDKHPARDFGDVNVFTNLDPAGEFVVSTRVRCGRSMEGYPFNPCLTEAQYKEMEAKVSSTLSGLEGELKGKFYPLTGMEKTVQQQLIDDHFLFKEGDRFLQTANACRYWPSGRGIYHNDAKTFLVWCNEEDHLRIISMQMGGDLGEVYKRLVTAVNDIEKRIPFSHNDRLGFLTFCPTNLGTTIRASVHIKVPKLAANLAKLEEIAGKYNLQVRGTRGEHTEAEGGIYDISNKRRMGLTEFDAVKEMYDGIAELIKIEKSL